MLRRWFSYGRGSPARQGPWLSRSLVFLTPGAIEDALKGRHFPGRLGMSRTSTCLAAAQSFARNRPAHRGTSVGTICFVSMDYFHRKPPFRRLAGLRAGARLHTCKPRTVNLPETRRRVGCAFSLEMFVRWPHDHCSRLTERSRRQGSRVHASSSAGDYRDVVAALATAFNPAGIDRSLNLVTELVPLREPTRIVARKPCRARTVLPDQRLQRQIDS
jgi:hypothetical protein